MIDMERIEYLERIEEKAMSQVRYLRAGKLDAAIACITELDLMFTHASVLDCDYKLPVGSGNLKQVIVVRKDLNMRKGKIGAQVAHGSLAVTLENMDHPDVKEWLAGIFTKICVSCDSLDELLELKQKADDADIINALITDSGKTEFKNVATCTVLAIGPAHVDEIDKITGALNLL